MAWDLADNLPIPKEILSVFGTQPEEVRVRSTSQLSNPALSIRPIRNPGSGTRSETKPSVSVIIPLYNEERTIGQCIDQCAEVMEGEGYDYEILVVDDGSTDDSHSVARRAMLGRRDRIHLLRHSSNLGKGSAVYTAANRASKDILVIHDADLEYPPSQIPELIAPITRGEYDVVYGSRFLGRADGMSPSHRLGNWLLTTATNILFRTAFTDVMTGHKVFANRAFHEMRTKTARFTFEVECTSLAVMGNFNIAEVPAEYQARDNGGAKIRWTDGLTCLAWLVGFKLLRFLRTR